MTEAPHNNVFDDEHTRGVDRTYSADSPRSMTHLRRREQQQASSPDSLVRRRSPSPHHQRRASQPSEHNNNNDTKDSSKSGLFQCAGKSHFVVLFMGMMLGYLLLPVLLIEVQLTDFLDRFPVETLQTSGGPFVREQNYFLRTTESRALEGEPSNKKKNKKPKSAIQSSLTGGELSSMASDIEQRLREDQDVLSRQSMPTATTPYIMKTKVLPDHHRLKILVTGGAGFVGSHLVDKLMMEGHEVIVVDNFFTGQKKNVAHWLHHPLFR